MLVLYVFAETDAGIAGHFCREGYALMKLGNDLLKGAARIDRKAPITSRPEES
jgi:hypothetical protein